MARKLPFRPVRDPRHSARAAGLHYATDRNPGITRRRRGRAFQYYRPDGRRVTRASDLDRIRRLAIPPAWQRVWIAPDPLGHLQATGIDARGRKQYRYHPRWREVRDETKYGRMIEFGLALPSIRRRTAADLRRDGLPREKVLAAVVRLLEKTFIRVGNDEYARQNHSFGLTTMRDGHVKVNGSTVKFLFRGKSGVEHDLELDDRRLARIVKQCRDLPGQELFQYRDDSGRVVDVGSADVNAYLQAITGRDFTSKDFRTWAGTVLAATLLAEHASAESASGAKKTIVRIVEQVAARLGNTKAVCRKCYIHPAVLDAFLDGSMSDAGSRGGRVARGTERLTAAEAAVLSLLQRRIAQRAS
jgi:DNA topoisomerase-1